MNEIQIFQHEQFGSIRSIVINDEPWFVGKDVAQVLGYSNTKKALADHVDAEDKKQGDGVTIRDPMGREQSPTIINESGLYSLVLSSKLPTAKQFKRWVTAEVLPTIRKTGGYVSNEELFLNTYLPNADEATRNMFSATLAVINDLNSKIEADKPKVLFADAVAASETSILVGELAKLIKQNGVDIGQNRLFKWLRSKGYLTQTNEPTQRSMDMKLLEVVERTVNNPDGSVRITRTTKVTGKGQTYFINKFLGGQKNVSAESE